MENAFLQAAYVLLTAEPTWAILGHGHWPMDSTRGTLSSPEGHVILPSPHIWSSQLIRDFGVETKQCLESPLVGGIPTPLKNISQLG